MQPNARKGNSYRGSALNAGATSGNSNKSDNEIQEFDVGNISEEETEEEIPVEYLNLLKPIVSVLRQSAGFF